MNASEMTGKAQQLQDKAQEWQETAKQKAREWQEVAKEKARQAGQVTDQYVHENTWQTLAIVAGVGIILGFMLAKMRD